MIKGSCFVIVAMASPRHLALQILKCPLVPHKDPNKLFHAKKALRRKTSLPCCWGLCAYLVVTFEQSPNPQLPPKPPQIIHANELFFHVIRHQITESNCANSLKRIQGYQALCRPLGGGPRWVRRVFLKFGRIQLEVFSMSGSYDGLDTQTQLSQYQLFYPKLVIDETTLTNRAEM